MKERIKMTPQERAKQFAPFAALRGHGEELSKVSRPPVVPRPLTEDEERILNARLKKKQKGEEISLLILEGDRLQRITGTFTLLDEGMRTLRVGSRTVPLTQIYWVSK